MTRLRSPAQRAPQTTEAATALLARYAEAATLVDGHEAERTAAIARIDAATDACIVPLAAELKDLAKQLKPWWEASFDELTAGRRKSIELGGCLVGYRMTPPKVTFSGGKDDAAVAALTGTDLADALLRTKVTLDKPAVLKMLGDDGDQLAELGFAAEQKEEFFIDVAATRPALA